MHPPRHACLLLSLAALSLPPVLLVAAFVASGLLAGGPAAAGPVPGGAFHPANTAPEAVSFAAPIERAQGADDWYAQEAVAAAMRGERGGQTFLQATMTMTPGLGKTRLDLADGTVAVFDGERSWVAPADSAFRGGRFHLMTWPYFLAVPMKLRDPGTHLEPLGRQELAGRSYDTAKLTFGAGVGDAPDDWYVLYRDPESQRLAAMVFIVTYGRNPAEAEQHPEVILYGGWTKVGAVTVPTEWKLHRWSAEGGVGEPLAEVHLEGVRFVDPAPDTFTPPAGAREEPAPPPAKEAS